MIWEKLFIIKSQKEKNNYSNKIHFGVIATLPGSGAEASKTCVINSSKGKEFLISRDFIPNLFFMIEINILK